MNAHTSDFDTLVDAGPVAKGGLGFTHEKPITGEKVDWYTPSWIFEALGLEFDIDPCAPQGGLPWIPAKHFCSLPKDGLALEWRGRIWCNPPYGPATKLWLERMGQHRNGVSLVFARTDTEWYHLYAKPADAILFLEGRVKFVDRSGEPPMVFDKRSGKFRESGPGCGSMLVAWGEENVAALRRMDAAGHGHLIERPRADDFGGLL